MVRHHAPGAAARRITGLDWSRVDTRSRALGARTSVALGVLLACGSLGVGMPEAAARWVDGNWRARHLASLIRRRLLGEPESRIVGDWYWLLLLDSACDRLRLCDRTLREYSRRLRPNKRDVEFVTLPAPLHFLHYGVRPIRLAIERLKALRKRTENRRDVRRGSGASRFSARWTTRRVESARDSDPFGQLSLGEIAQSGGRARVRGQFHRAKCPNCG